MKDQEMQRNPYLMNRAFRVYLLATILSTMAVALGSVFNGIVVGNLIGPDALSAVNLCSPLLQMLNAISALINIGGATLAATYLGRGRRDDYRRIFRLSFHMSIVAGILLMIAGLFFLDQISSVLCSDSSLLPMVKEYTFVILMSGVLAIMLPGMCAFVRTDGNPKLSTYALITFCLTNIILDIVFISGLGMGIGGSAIATACGYVTGLIVLSLHRRHPMRMISFSGKGGSVSRVAILQMGAPVAIASLLMTVRILGLNILVLGSLGSEGASVMAVCINLMVLSSVFIGGTSQTMQPVCGVLYGSEDHTGMDMVIKRALTILMLSLIVITIIIFIFPSDIASIFGIRDDSVLSYSDTALRMFALSLPLYGINYFLMIIYQISGRKALASVVSALQSLVVLVVAAIFVFDGYSDMIWAAFAVGESIVFLVILVMSVIMRFRSGTKMLTLIKRHVAKGDELEMSVKNNGEDMSLLMDSMDSFLERNGAGKQLRTHVRLCCEELVINIMEHGSSGNKGYIDVTIRMSDGNSAVLCLRDDSFPFDPINYDKDGRGLMMVKRICTSLQYSRVIGQNVVVAKLSG
ncbi:MAG: ATP-binding protein [Candidatus Methanogranum gryphiswaldense]|nr:MAG: ATP-binding protein [Candidatus Methanogranum sp. U3.2.1]